MIRRRRWHNYKPEENPDDEFDETFIVSGQETFFIYGQEIVVEDAVHAIKDGQEYVIINNQIYPIDKSAESPDDKFDDTFIVSGQETFYVNDQKIVVEGAVHAIKENQEYVIIDNQLYPIEGSALAPDTEQQNYRNTQQYVPPPPARSSMARTLGIFIVFAILGVIITLFAGSFIIGLASGISDPDNANIITPNGKSDTNPTPEITRVQSTESQTATKIKNAMDYTNPTTRDFALTLIPNTHEGNYNIAQICDLWEAVYQKWTYVNDPQGSDYFSPASRTIQLGLKGDCDDFAITVGSLVQSIGGSTRIVTAYNAEGGHAYPEVYIGSSKASLEKVASYIGKRYHTTGIAYHARTKDGVTQYWLNLDWQSRFPGGKYFHESGEMTIYYPNGYWYQTS